MGAAASPIVPEALAEFARRLNDPTAAGTDLLLVVAHPDDETIGIGGHLSQLSRMPLICITDGAPADLRDAHAHGFATAADYAAARQWELDAALEEAGHLRTALLCLGIPDQRAAHQLVPLTQRLAGLIAKHAPHFVIAHAYEGGHPDHDAAAFAVAAAVNLCRREGQPVPTIVEMPFYHATKDGTIYQRFCGQPELPELVLHLSPAAVALKTRMLDCHATQRETLALFSRQMERFRLAPAYDFNLLPNGGQLQYERWRLGTTGQDWLELVRNATAELGRSA